MGRIKVKKAPKASSETAQNISIALVEPQSSGNVGSVARAMRNTGFSNLVLVNPCDYLNNDSYSMACKADDVLRKATVYKNLNDCVKDAGIIVGTTRRKGRIRYPVATLQESVPRILELASSNKVFILFGREDRGLENDEVPVCDMLIEVPTSPDYPSLNLSHAVFIVCYSLFTAECPIEAPVVKAAPRQELDRMYLHMEATLRSLGYGEQGGEYLIQAILRSFKRLFGRTGLMQKEINMLRGIFTQVVVRAGRKENV